MLVLLNSLLQIQERNEHFSGDVFVQTLWNHCPNNLFPLYLVLSPLLKMRTLLWVCHFCRATKELKKKKKVKQSNWKPLLIYTFSKASLFNGFIFQNQKEKCSSFSHININSVSSISWRIQNINWKFKILITVNILDIFDNIQVKT